MIFASSTNHNALVPVLLNLLLLLALDGGDALQDPTALKIVKHHQVDLLRFPRRSCTSIQRMYQPWPRVSTTAVYNGLRGDCSNMCTCPSEQLLAGRLLFLDCLDLISVGAVT